MVALVASDLYVPDHRHLSVVTDWGVGTQSGGCMTMEPLFHSMLIIVEHLFFLLPLVPQPIASSGSIG